MSVTHLLNFKFSSVRRISSKRLNSLDIYKKAYKEIVLKSNYGNKDFTDNKFKMLDMTPSIKKVKLEGLMESIKKWSYKCQPIKKVYIKKANGKLRPLGVPSINDKIIQTVIKLLIEQECDNTTFSVCNETS
jgi:retron-type reverse transcriptase